MTRPVGSTFPSGYPTTLPAKLPQVPRLPVPNALRPAPPAFPLPSTLSSSSSSFNFPRTRPIASQLIQSLIDQQEFRSRPEQPPSASPSASPTPARRSADTSSRDDGSDIDTDVGPSVKKRPKRYTSGRALVGVGPGLTRPQSSRAPPKPVVVDRIIPVPRGDRQMESPPIIETKPLIGIKSYAKPSTLRLR